MDVLEEDVRVGEIQALGEADQRDDVPLQPRLLLRSNTLHSHSKLCPLPRSRLAFTLEI